MNFISKDSTISVVRNDTDKCYSNSNVLVVNNDKSMKCSQPASLPISSGIIKLQNGFILDQPPPQQPSILRKAQHSLLKMPVPVIPIQFQKPFTLPFKPSVGPSLVLKSETVPSAAPSGAKLPTISHANRALVYRKPVSTGTAPTKHLQKKDFINLTDLVANEVTVETTPSPTVEFIDINCQAQNDHSTVCFEAEPSTSDIYLPRPVKEELRHQANHLNKELGEKLTKELHCLQDASQPQPEWDEPDSESISVKLATSVKDMFDKCQMMKRNRAKSTMLMDSIEDNVLPKVRREKSLDAIEIINLDDVPQDGKLCEPRTYRSTAGHDYLYNMLRSDASKVLKDRISDGAPKTIAKVRKESNGVKPLPRTIQIARIHSQNAAIASLPTKDKLHKLKESMESTKSMLSSLENGEEKPVSIPYEGLDRIKRTYSRSKSVSKLRNTSRLHFKIGTIDNFKAKKANRKTVESVNHDHDWQAFQQTLATHVPKSDMPSSGSATPSEQGKSRAQSPSEIEQTLTWNTSKTLGQLPNSKFIFQVNEFGTIEMDTLSMTKIQALKLHKNDYKNFPQIEPSMACGHPDSAACFDAIIQRLNGDFATSSCKLNDKKPHQYYSPEFRAIIGALVQKKNNDCQAITANSIRDALRETNMHDRTKNSSHFDWPRFIDYFNKKSPADAQIKLAPTQLFSNPQPTTPNTFEIGQKLEAIDPQNSSLFSVCTIVDKCGYRIKLHFDGYMPAYDFWVNADSMNIFPAGWCSKTGRELEVHRRFINGSHFEWKDYLRQTNTQAAHRACFLNLNTARTQMNPFKIGMKLEADDLKSSSRICVATIGDVIDSRILVTLDGFDSSLNYWTDIRSPYVHPVNFHKDHGYSITTPPVWRSSVFSWESYLRSNRAEAVPKEAFYPREPKPFEVGMALEVVDKKNPSLIRPAVVTMIHDYHIKVLFIGWPENYAFWVEDDSCDIFPPGYCKKTGHPIECPLDFIYELPKNSCGITGCRGIGNGKYPETSTHTTVDECPYEKANWSAEESSMRPSRVDRKHKAINTAFNIGAGPSRKVSVNPAFEKVQVSLQPTLNPTELAAMSSKDVEIFRRLQVSANFLLENQKFIAEVRDRWIERMKPLRPVQVLAAAKNPLNWTTEEVAAFVSQLPNCSMLGTTFSEHEIDGVAFLSLRQDDMVDIMGLSIGSAIKVFNRIVFLREECNAHYIRYK